MRVIRKAIGLLIVDIVIIIGIFILQFRTDSSILRKLGNFQITMAKNESPDSTYQLQNKLDVSYNGISIHSDDQNSIKIIKKGESVARPVRLIEYIEDELQYTFHFTEQVSLIFMLPHNESDAPLTIFADVPKEISDMYVPFNFAYNMKVQRNDGNRIILDGKKKTWAFSSEDLLDNYIHFTYADNLAHYSIYDETRKFSFDSVIELAAADQSTYEKTVDAFGANLISAFKSSINEGNFTEQAVTAYISEMSKQGNYQQAIDEIPQEYKKSESRTYLSAPFLNNLANMNKTLEATQDEMNRKIKNAAATGSLDMFTTEKIAAWLCVYPDSMEVSTILHNVAAANIQNLSISQVSGILLAFADFSKLHTEYAEALLPVVDACIERITAACSYDNEILTISENDTFLSVLQAVETGIALLRYGQAIADQTYVKAGRVLVNSYIEESASFDLRTLASLYPLLRYDNWYYPHLELINSYGKNAVWAWTCAQSIRYTKDDEGAMNLAIDFPQGLTHYVIFKGIPAFEQIFIYDMAFRTDPRFETYNSSGYVFRSETNTLLLKSRHKSKIENVRMTYTPVARPAPAPDPAPKPAEPVEAPAVEPEPEPESTPSALELIQALQNELNTPEAQ